MLLPPCLDRTEAIPSTSSSRSDYEGIDLQVLLHRNPLAEIVPAKSMACFSGLEPTEEDDTLEYVVHFNTGSDDFDAWHCGRVQVSPADASILDSIIARATRDGEPFCGAQIAGSKTCIASTLAQLLHLGYLINC